MMASGAAIVPTRYMDMYSSYMNSCAGNVLRLKDIWEDCGYTAESIDERMLKVFNWFEERWQTIIDDEAVELESRRQKVQAGLQELCVLYEELGLPEPFQREHHPSLQEQLDWIDESRSRAEALRTARETRLLKLRSEELALINSMTDQQTLKFAREKSIQLGEAIVSEAELKDLEDHVAGLAAEKQARYNRLRSLIDECGVLMASMGKVPKLAIEEQLLLVPLDKWDLSKSNIDQVISTRQALHDEAAHLRSRHAALLKQLDKMFLRLKVTQAERNEVLDDLVSATTYQALQRLEELLEEYKLLMEANMAVCVERLQSEARRYHDMLRTGEQFVEPSDLRSLLEQGPSEPLILAYEELVEDLKQRHTLLEPLFELLDEREKLTETLRQLDEAQKDPMRFKNRGGALLQEIKKRERATRGLSSISQQVLKFLDAHEPVHGTVVVNGCPIRNSFPQKPASTTTTTTNVATVSADNLTSFKSRNGSGNLCAAQTPGKGLRPIAVTGAKPSLMHVQRGLAFKRSGTFTEVKATRTKPIANTLQACSVRHQEPKSTANAGARLGLRRSPGHGGTSNDSSKSNSLTAKRKLRRSVSYSDFECNLSSNDLHSTRVAPGESTSDTNSRRLFF